MKKRLSFLLAMAMVITVLAGCSQQPVATQAPAAPAETQAAATTAAPAATTAATAETEAAAAPAEETPASWLCDEKTTLSILTYDGVNNTFPAPSNDLPFWQFMEDYTNVHIEWEIVPNAGYKEVIAARLASGADLPDIVMTDDFLAANNAGKNGIFEDLSAHWDDCFQNTEKYFADQGQDYRALLKNEDGTCYSIVGTVAPVEGHIVYCYNTEWLQKLGKEVPKTLDEFNELIEAMKAAGDLNGNGEDDEVIFTSSSLDTLGSVMNNTFGMNAYEAWDQFAVQDGKVFPEYTSDNEKAYFAYLNKLYTDGILDPEIGSMTADMLSEKIAADRVGVFVYYSAFAITYGQLTTAGQADKMAEHYTLGYPLASEWNDNKAYFIRREKTASCPTCVNAASDNIELACKWIDVMFADPEVLKIRTCGFEGEDFKDNGDGTIELIYPADGAAWSIVEKGCGQIALAFIQTKEQLLNSKLQYTWYVSEYDDIRANCDWRAPQITQVSAFTDEEQEMRDDVRTDVLDYYKEMREKFITGASSIDGEWETYVSNIQKLGLDTLTASWQSVYDRTK